MTASRDNNNNRITSSQLNHSNNNEETNLPPLMDQNAKDSFLTNGDLDSYIEQLITTSKKVVKDFIDNYLKFIEEYRNTNSQFKSTTEKYYALVTKIIEAGDFENTQKSNHPLANYMRALNKHCAAVNEQVSFQKINQELKVNNPQTFIYWTYILQQCFIKKDMLMAYTIYSQLCIVNTEREITSRKGLFDAAKKILESFNDIFSVDFNSKNFRKLNELEFIIPSIGILSKDLIKHKNDLAGVESLPENERKKALKNIIATGLFHKQTETLENQLKYMKNITSQTDQIFTPRSKNKNKKFKFKVKKEETDVINNITTSCMNTSTLSEANIFDSWKKWPVADINNSNNNNKPTLNKTSSLLSLSLSQSLRSFIPGSNLSSPKLTTQQSNTNLKELQTKQLDENLNLTSSTCNSNSNSTPTSPRSSMYSKSTISSEEITNKLKNLKPNPSSPPSTGTVTPTLSSPRTKVQSNPEEITNKLKSLANSTSSMNHSSPPTSPLIQSKPKAMIRRTTSTQETTPLQHTLNNAHSSSNKPVTPIMSPKLTSSQKVTSCLDLNNQQSSSLNNSQNNFLHSSLSHNGRSRAFSMDTNDQDSNYETSSSIPIPQSSISNLTTSTPTSTSPISIEITKASSFRNKVANFFTSTEKNKPSLHYSGPTSPSSSNGSYLLKKNPSLNFLSQNNNKSTSVPSLSQIITQKELLNKKNS